MRVDLEQDRLYAGLPSDGSIIAGRRGIDMPIYEYHCSDCGHAFEALVRSSTVPECPSCRSKDLEKQLSVFATTGTSTNAVPMMPSPCGSCPNSSGGPGGCSFN